MKTLGVRELKERISEVLHLVREKGEIIDACNTRKDQKPWTLNCP